VMGNNYVGIIHPCKIYNVLAAKRSFLYIGPTDSHVQDIVSQVGRGAYVAGHGDVEAVTENILQAIRCRTIILPTISEVGKRFSKDFLIPQMICAIEQCRDANARA
jgi:colanic acid biosynthesis glycosyl transferase WcaI